MQQGVDHVPALLRRLRIALFDGRKNPADLVYKARPASREEKLAPIVPHAPEDSNLSPVRLPWEAAVGGPADFGPPFRDRRDGQATVDGPACPDALCRGLPIVRRRAVDNQ